MYGGFSGCIFRLLISTKWRLYITCVLHNFTCDSLYMCGKWCQRFGRHDSCSLESHLLSYHVLLLSRKIQRRVTKVSLFWNQNCETLAMKAAQIECGLTKLKTRRLRKDQIEVCLNTE